MYCTTIQYAQCYLAYFYCVPVHHVYEQCVLLFSNFKPKLLSLVFLKPQQPQHFPTSIQAHARVSTRIAETHRMSACEIKELVVTVRELSASDASASGH